IEFELRVLSAHRTPLETLDFARSAAERGLRVIIAGAGAAAALPGALAGATSLPVIGVPIAATTLGGLDALLSMVQMPSGVPVATVAIAGARNAGLLAVRILASSDPSLRSAMQRFQTELADAVRARDVALQTKLGAG